MKEWDNERGEKYVDKGKLGKEKEGRCKSQ